MASTSIADLPPHIQRQVREKLEAEDKRRRHCIHGLADSRICPDCRQPPKRKSKYSNTRTPFKSVQGFTVMADSKLEAKMFADLDQQMVRGVVAWWIPHPRFPLPGGVVYEADALVIGREGSFERQICIVLDAKGRDTQASINKRKQVAELFGVTVELVRK